MWSRLHAGLLKTYMRAPDHPAKLRIVDWLGRNVFPEPGIRSTVYPDTALFLHPRDWIEHLLLRGEQYEPQTLRFLTSNLRRGDVAVVAGVNFGLHAAVAARAVGADGLVIGVEPQPAALLRADQNLRLNGVRDRVRLVGAALGAHEDLVPMAWADPGNPGSASLTDQGPGITVPVLSLTRILDALSPARPRVVLLDVQGSEQAALAGLEDRWRPEILIVEVDPLFLDKAGSDPARLLRSVSDLGYSLFTLEGAEASPDSPEIPERNLIGLRPGAKAVWSMTGSP